MPGLMSGDWKRSTVSGPQRLQLDAWTAPDLSATAPAPDSILPMRDYRLNCGYRPTIYPNSGSGGATYGSRGFTRCVRSSTRPGELVNFGGMFAPVMPPQWWSRWSTNSGSR
jgi:hypothetical protein